MYDTGTHHGAAVSLDYAGSTSGLLGLPAELIGVIASEMANNGLYSFRLAARGLYANSLDTYRMALNAGRRLTYSRPGLDLLGSLARHPYLLRGYVEIWFPQQPQRDALLLTSKYHGQQSDAWRAAKALADGDRLRTRRGNVLAERLTETLLCLERREKGIIVRFERL